MVCRFTCPDQSCKKHSKVGEILRYTRWDQYCLTLPIRIEFVVNSIIVSIVEILLYPIQPLHYILQMFTLNLTDFQIRLIFSFCCVQLIRASTGDSVSISVYTPPPSGFGINLLKAEIETVSSKKSTRPGSALELDSLDISKHIISRFADQVHCSYLLR